MRKFVGLATGIAVACVGAAQVRGSDLLAGMAQALNRAQSVKASYSITPIGGASVDYTVELSKPNLARIEGPSRLVIATGKDVVTFDKDLNAFVRRPQLSNDATKILAPSSTEMFVPFFEPNYYQNVVNPRSVGRVNRKGQILEAVQYSTGSFPFKQWTYYVSPDDQLPRQAQFVLKTDTSTTTSVYDTRSVSTDPIPAERFEWKPAAEAKEVNWTNVAEGKWYTDLDEAQLAAALTDRLVFVMFYADWSHASKGLEFNVFSKDEFKRMSESFVFCKIEAAKTEDFEKFKVTEVPTLFILRPNGSVLRKIVGMKPLGEIVSTMKASYTAVYGSTR